MLVFCFNAKNDFHSGCVIVEQIKKCINATHADVQI